MINCNSVNLIQQSHFEYSPDRHTSHTLLFMSVWLFSPFHCVPPHHCTHTHPSTPICSIIFTMHDSTYPYMYFFDFYMIHITKQASIYAININFYQIRIYFTLMTPLDDMFNVLFNNILCMYVFVYQTCSDGPDSHYLLSLEG